MFPLLCRSSLVLVVLVVSIALLATISALECGENETAGECPCEQQCEDIGNPKPCTNVCETNARLKCGCNQDFFRLDKRCVTKKDCEKAQR